MRKLASLAAVCALAVAGAAHARTQPSSFQVRLADPVSQPLTDPQGDALLSRTSPDAQHEVSWRDGTLVVSSTNGVVERTVAQVPGRILYAVWSPNARVLAFESLDGHGFHVWTARVDGRGQQLVRDGGAQPAWAPDSRRLAFVDRFDAQTFTGTLATAASDGTALRELTPREGVFAPAWSPDGRWIAYRLTTRARRAGRIVAVAADGAATRRDLGAGESFAWSPDARHVAIVEHAARRLQTLEVADVASPTTVRIATANAIQAVAWSHAGTRLAYGAKTRYATNLVVARPDGGPGMTIAPPFTWARGSVVQIAWSKDDATLYYAMRL